MNNKKGFTLVELLSVIIILGIVLSIAIPNITGAVKNSRIKAYIEDESELVKAAKSYAIVHIDKIPKNISDTTEITLSDLQVEKYIGTMTSSYDKSKMCNGYILVTKVADRNYKYVPHLNCDENISNSSEDKLVGHWTFDDFQEPTTNIYANYADLSKTRSLEIIDGNNTLSYGDNSGYDEPYYVERITKSAGTPAPYASYRRCVPSGGINNNFTLSFKAKILSGNISSIGSHLNGGNGAISPKYQDAEGWYHFEASTVTANESLLCVGASFIGDNAVDVLITEPQVEFKSYATPFVNGTRTGTVYDYSLNSNAATLPFATSPKWVNSGILKDGAYQFDGVDDYISVSNFNYNVLKQGQETAAWTMSAWVKPAGTQAGQERIIVGRAGCHGGIYAFPSTLNFSIKTTSCWTNSKSIAYTPANMTDWENLVAVYNNRNMYFYVNGKLLGTAYFDATTSAYSNVLYIGGIGSYLFKGTIDDVRIYSRALSTAEIQDNYDVIEYKSR